MRIGILSAQLGEEDVDENRRLTRETLLLGHKSILINYRRAVVVTAGRKQMLYQPDKKGILRPVKVDAVIPRINEADSKSINLATLALETLIAGGVYSTASPAAIRLSKDKVRSLVTMAQAGVAVPRTAAITTASSTGLDLDRVLKTVEPNAARRLIVKTNVGTHGRGVMPANSRGEARAIIEGFLANNIPILLQQFVEPTKKNQYEDLRLIVVNGKALCAMKRTATRRDEVRANLSLGGKGIQYKPSEAEIAMAEKAARAVGLSIAGVDLIPSGKRRLAIEVNSSPGFIVEKIGKINLANKMVRQAVTNANRQERAMQKLAARLNEPITLQTLQPISRVTKSAALKRLKVGPIPAANKF